MLRKVLLVTVIAGVAIPVHQAMAQERDNGWFATLQYGQADYDVSLGGEARPWLGDVDDDGDAFAIGVGYDVLPELGLRLMYERVGGVAAANRCPAGSVCPAVVFEESTRTENWSLVAMPRLRFSENWEAYGTIGAMQWNIEPRGTLSDDDGTAFIYGAGFGYRFGSGLGIGAEYQRASVDYDALRLNVSYEL
jgi:opacity protein-like surface antigen